MKSGPSRLRRAITILVALLLVGAVYHLSQLPTLPSTEATAIAARFRFEKLPFAEPAKATPEEIKDSLAETVAYPIQLPRIREMAKEAVGRAAHRPGMEAEGKLDQGKGNFKQAGEKLKDAGRRIFGS